MQVQCARGKSTPAKADATASRGERELPIGGACISAHGSADLVASTRRAQHYTAVMNYAVVMKKGGFA